MISDFQQLEDLANDWQRLWQSHRQPEIFQSFTWTRAWWQSYGEGLRLRVAVVQQAGEIVLILPLVQSRGVLRFLGSPQSDYCDILCCHPQPAQPLTVALQSLLGEEWKECVLENLRRDSHFVQAYASLPRELRHLLRAEVSDTCPTIRLGDHRGPVVESLLANKHLRRRQRKLQKSGEVTFRHIESQEEIQHQLTQFFRCHRRRCALLAKTSCFEEAAMRKMMRAVASMMDAARELRFGVLELNGRPQAWSLGFQLKGKYAYYQQTFDVDAEEYGPGEILLYHLFLYAKDAIDKEIDFLRGDEFFKLRFANHSNNILNLYFERPGFRGQWRRAQRLIVSRCKNARHPVVSFVRSHQTMFRVFRFIWVWKRTQSHRLRWARSTRQLTGYLLTCGLDLFHFAIWNREAATLFRRKEGDSQPPESAPNTTAGFTIKRGRFSDLADLALEYPEMPMPRFQEYRERLKRGDQVYLVSTQGEVNLVAWVRANGALSNNAPGNRESAAVTMYECWPIHNPEPGCTRLLSILAADALETNVDFLVCCPEVPPTSCAVLDRQGYVPMLRITTDRILHWFRHRNTRSELHVISDPPPHTVDCVCPKLRKRSKP